MALFPSLWGPLTGPPMGGGQRQVVPKYLSSPLPVLVLGWARFWGSLAFRLLGGFGLASFGFYLARFGWAWLWLDLGCFYQDFGWIWVGFLNSRLLLL